MSAIDDVLSAIPMDQLAGRLGVDRATAEDAARKALPALLGGMEANAQDPAGAASLQRAIGSHDSGLVEGGVDLDEVDTDDGDKIVSNVFGPNRDQVVNQLGATGGSADGSLVGKLLPVLAPIAMAYLAKQVKQRGATSGSGNGGGGALTDILGSVLGGGGGAGGGIDLGGLLGGLLGGGKR
jgi:hypothetical protein